MLEVEALEAGYGETRVLHGLSLTVGRGEVVALLGRNGVGKTTTLRAIMGLLPPRAGRVRIDGRDVTGLPAHRIARLGVGYVPETRDIFPSLTVAENLELARRLGRREGPWDPERIYALFPRLHERRDNPGTALSGGEQQMLAIARALIQNPQLLLLDEPTEGLAPIVVQEIRAKLRELIATGLTVLLVEQNFRFATPLASRCYVLARGRVAWHGPAVELAASEELQRRLLAV